MKPQKVIYIESSTSGVYGGSHESLYQLISNLNRKKFIPHLILYEEGNYISRVKKTGIDVTVVPIKKGKSKSFNNEKLKTKISKNITSNNIFNRFYEIYLSYISPVKKLLLVDVKRLINILPVINNLEPNLIHLNNGFQPTPEGVLVGKLLNIPVISHIRKYRNYNWLEKMIGRLSDYIICNSYFVKDNCIRQKLGDSKIEKVYNPIASPPKLLERSDKTDEKSLNVDNATFVIGMVANYVEWKNHLDLVRAINILSKSYNDIHCILVGGTSEDQGQIYQSVVDEINRCNIGRYFTITGYREDVYELYPLFDVLVHPAINEPFGRVIIEAMINKVPVIATDTGGPAEIIKEGITGVLVPPNSPESLASALEEVIEQRDYCRRLGESAYKYANTHFSPQLHAKSIENIYSRFSLDG